MGDPASEGSDDRTSYPAFLRTADEIDRRVGLLIAELVGPAIEERNR